MQRLAKRRSAHLSALALALATLTLSAGVVSPAASAEMQVESPAPAPAASEGRIVISEVAAGSSLSDADSFFELQNIDDHAIDLTGWQVFRCSAQGLRSNYSRPESDLRGVVLEPGAIAVVSRIGVALGGTEPDGLFTQPYMPTGFGLILTDASGATADAIGVYPSEPWPTESECSERGNVPASLAFALDESWQRVSDTGDVAVDFVRAEATPGSPDRGRVAGVSGVVAIDEIAAAGPAGSDDDVIELRNPGAEPVDLSGWTLYRCARDGTLSAATAQVAFPDGATLAAGERLVVSSRGDGRFTSATSLADTVSGALLVDAEGHRVDGVSVSNHPDTACQTGDTKLPSVLDYRAGESWQRHPATGEWLIAERTAGRANARVDTRLAADTFAYEESPDIAISEIAVDPVIDPAIAETAGVASSRHHFVELGNYGDRPVDLGGWRLVACGNDGFRESSDLVVITPGTRLDPGQTWTAALEGTDAAGTAQAQFTDELDFRGAGVWVEDASGARVDSVGIFHANEMDHSIERYSPCTKGMSLSTFALDRLIGETWQRARFTGSDADDFVHARATPGELDERGWVEAGELTPAAAGRIAAETGTESRIESISTGGAGPSATEPVRRALTGDAATVLEAFAGSSEAGALTERSAPNEQRVADAALAAGREDAWAYPYVRLRMRVPEASGVVSWAGSVTGAAPVRLSAWAPDDGAWRALDEVAAADEGATHEVVLSGSLRAGEAVDGVAEVLVQVVPARAAADQTGFADPDDYDLAVSHITDTQYLSEAYPEVYAEQLAWVRASQEARKISFVAHTGDLIQNWVDPDQEQPRARREYEVASTTQATLDAAGIPNSVLPGNHDNKRGVTNDLFNEYFGPDRYAGSPWYGGSIAPEDNSANFTLFERAGARFLVLSLPYGYAERELAWAEKVVSEHPDRNVIVATHEHLSAMAEDNPPARSTSSRWLSRADELWTRVVAPNRNVVLVLAGHFHGLSRIDTTDAGGIAGHAVTELLADYQEFRTHTGERATGFQRLLQIDLAGGTVHVDTFSATLGEYASFPYDYEQAVADNGHDTSGSNARPWRILDHGLQDRYTAADDDFSVRLSFQFDKAVQTSAVTFASR